MHGSNAHRAYIHFKPNHKIQCNVNIMRIKVELPGCEGVKRSVFVLFGILIYNFVIVDDKNQSKKTKQKKDANFEGYRH